MPEIARKMSEFVSLRCWRPLASMQIARKMSELVSLRCLRPLASRPELVSLRCLRLLASMQFELPLRCWRLTPACQSTFRVTPTRGAFVGQNPHMMSSGSAGPYIHAHHRRHPHTLKPIHDGSSTNTTSHPQTHPRRQLHGNLVTTIHSVTIAATCRPTKLTRTTTRSTRPRPGPDQTPPSTTHQHRRPKQTNKVRAVHPLSLVSLVGFDRLTRHACSTLCILFCSGSSAVHVCSPDLAHAPLPRPPTNSNIPSKPTRLERVIRCRLPRL
jgi:hypothetical protein